MNAVDRGLYNFRSTTTKQMILAFDSYYSGNKANTVCLAFDKWTAGEAIKVYSEVVENIEEYIPGEFYKRELPCILSLFKKVDISDIEAIIIDGFVFLDDNDKPGLGAHLYKTLDNKTPVIGVAKTNFAGIENNKRALLRGESKRPLYITAIGIDLDKATNKIKSMSGENRIPALLKELDGFTKSLHFSPE